MQQRLHEIVRALPKAGRLIFNKSYALRYLRNRWRYPGLDCDPTVHFTGKGFVEYLPGASLANGCNIVLASDARLHLGRHSYVGRQVELGPDKLIAIGDYTSIQDRCIILGNVRLGRYCVLSYDIYISSGHHEFDRRPAALIRDQDRESENPAMSSESDANSILIEEDVWLGVHVVVMPGTTIGRGCIVGANAVVTRSLPPYSVAAGVPAKILRKRFDFVPPPAIDWKNDNDIPYFYRGFEMSNDERRQHSILEGHVATGDFALSLKQGPDRKVCVRAKSLAGGRASIECDGKSYALSDVSAVYEFDHRGSDIMEAHLTDFFVKGGPVVVSNAWTR